MSRIFVLVIVAAISGCAQTKYDWGSYNQDLYNYYKSPASKVEFKQNLSSLIGRLEKQNKKPAPGIYAELGTLCLETGDRACAIKNYEKERNSWAESKPLMDTLLKTLSSQDKKEANL